METKSKTRKAHYTRLKRRDLKRHAVRVLTRTANAADMFAMPEPLSPAGEALWDDAMVQIERDRKKL
jgi:hypothetical protein